MQKKTNVQNFRLSAGLSSLSNHVMTLHPVKKEFRIAIIVLYAARILTMILAVFAGYSFFDTYIIKVISNPEHYKYVVIISVLFISFVEFMGAYSLEKTFKFFYRQRFFTAIALLLCAIILYGLSFISATEGLASRQAAKKDQTDVIKQNEKSELIKSEQLTAQLTAEIDLQITQIEKNPQGWSEGKRSHLTAPQLKKIADLNNKKDKIRNDFKTEKSEIENKTAVAIKENSIQTESTGNKYHKFMSYVMIFQVFVTGLLLFLLHRIRTEESRDSIISEDLKHIADTVEENAAGMIFNSIIGISNRMTDNVTAQILAHHSQDQPGDMQLKRILPELIKKEYTETEPETEPRTEKKPEKKPVRISGFGTQKTGYETENKTTDRLRYLKTATDIDLEYLKKHKGIVKAIKQLKPQTANSISNSEIENIQKFAKAEYKSRSLIQKVYIAMQNVPENIINEIIN